MKEYDICRKRIPPEYLSSLLILASVENNGYIREKAVREWATHLDPIAVRFLVDRLSDWVPQVRRAAWDSLQQYMKPEYFSCFLKRFYWIDRLLGKGNPDSFRYGEELVAFVMAHDFTEEIRRHLNESDYRNWKSYVDHSLNGQFKTNLLLFETVQKDPSPTIRSVVIRILDDLPETKRDELLEEALRDRAQPYRSRAF